MRTKITSLLLIATLVAIIPPINAEAAQTPDLPTSEREFNINAAGATFPFPLIDLWRVEYNNQYSNVNLNYQSIGSGGGIKQHIEKTVNFAASDKPLSESELENAPGTLHIPEAIGGVVVAYNIPEVPDKGLKLTGSVIADIYLGQITKWNDSRITELNPDLSLPDKEIIVAHRSDGSGTTFVFTDYLTKISSEFDKQVGAGKSVPWGDVSGDPTLVAAAGNEGVAGIIRSTDYSLGYIELAYAFQTGMSYAFIQNGDGTAFIEPTLESISAASSGVADNLPNASDSWNGVSLVNAPGSESYPIASFTYLLVYDDLKPVTNDIEQAKVVIHLIYWMITEGQDYSPTLLYVPLADKVIEIGKLGLSQVTYDGQTLWEYTAAETSEYQIPEWIKNNAKWWAEGQITDDDYIKGLQYLIDKGILKV